MKKIIKIVNDDGEILSDSAVSYSSIMNDDGYRFPHNKKSIRSFIGMDFPKEVNFADRGRLFFLAGLLVGKTNLIGYKSGRKIKAYTEKEIIDLVELKDRQGRQFIKKMYKNGILRRIETGTYMNPVYFISIGQRLTLDLFIIFQDHMKGFIPNWVIDEFLKQAREKKV